MYLPDRIRKKVDKLAYGINSVGMSGASVLCYDDMVLKIGRDAEDHERSKAMLTEENAYRQRIHDLEEQSPRPTATTVPEEQRKAILACIMHTMEQTEDFCDSNFTIERLAEKAGTNTRYASQVINQVFGKNFRTLLNEYRIKEAMRRLMDDDTYGKLTIKAISESVGYKSQANFITVFTRITGIKPSMYQKLSREEKEKKINA